MDEPTSALTAAETEALFRIIRDLKAQGVAIIYISHKLEELLTIGDYVTVLRDGKLAASAPAPSVNIAWIIDKMVGRDVNAPRHRVRTAVGGGNQTALEIKDLCLPRIGGGFTLENVSLTLMRGEILPSRCNQPAVGHLRRLRDLSCAIVPWHYFRPGREGGGGDLGSPRPRQRFGYGAEGADGRKTLRLVIV